MNQDDFDRLAAEGYNRIPVVREVAADLETPLSTYLKLADGPYSYLLESAQGGERWGRYSFIGLPCDTVIRVVDDTVSVETRGKTVQSTRTDDPLAFIEAYQGRFRVPKGESASAELPRFVGGLVGYFGYDTVRYTETRLALTTPPDPMQTPDILLMVSNDVIVFDNLRSRMQLITLVDAALPDAYANAMARLKTLASNLASPVPLIPETTTFQPPEEDDFVSEFGRENFMRAVERIREYILDGDVMQVVLAQRMSIPFNAAPINLYRALRSPEPVALHVFHASTGFPHSQFVAGNPGPGRRRRHREPPLGGYAPARPYA